METYELRAVSLFDKGGFWDGDMFADLYYQWLKDNKFETFDKSASDFLHAVVKHFLLPKLPLPVTIEKVITIHNGTRAVTVDGVEVTNENIKDCHDIFENVSVVLSEIEVIDFLEHDFSRFLQR